MAPDSLAGASDYSALEWLTALRSLFTIVAIVVGAIWTYKLFVQKRQKYPRANVSHSFSCWYIDNEKKLMRVTARVSNVGDVLLRVVSGRAWLLLVRPWPSFVLKAIEDEENPVSSGAREISWPKISGRSWKDGKVEIEPGETDCLHFDFVVGDALETVMVYTHLQNETKKHRLRFWKANKKVGWNTTTTHELPVIQTTDEQMSDDPKESKDKNTQQERKSHKDHRRERQDRRERSDERVQKDHLQYKEPPRQAPPRDEPDQDEVANQLGDDPED